MYEHGVLVGFGIILVGMGRAPTVGGVLPSVAQSPFGKVLVAPGDSAWEFARKATLEPYFFKPGTTPTCVADLLSEWDGTTAGAANLFIGTTMHFALSDMSAITCAPAPPRSPPPPPPCTNLLLKECKDECSKSHIVCKSACEKKTKKKKKCKRECKKDKKKCKKTCGTCDP